MKLFFTDNQTFMSIYPPLTFHQLLLMKLFISQSNTYHNQFHVIRAAIFIIFSRWKMGTKKLNEP